MPVYTFSCPSCGETYHPILGFSEYDRIRAGEEGSHVFCDCGETCRPVFDPGYIGATFKEGETGGWASKNLKEKDLRQKRRAVLTQKNKDHVNPSPLVPNYNGVTHDRWSEVRDHVRMKEGDAVASTYDPFVKKQGKP